MGVLRHPLKSDLWVTALLLLALSLPLALSGVISRLDNLLYDVGQKFNYRTPPDDIVIVAIDENSLSQLGRWPWSRRHHAQLIERLHDSGAKAIGLDILMSEPQLDDPLADKQLAQAIQKADNVVLPLVIEQVRQNGQLVENLPISSLGSQAKGIGRVHAELDTDSIARSIFLWEGIGQPSWPHFAQAMLSTAKQLPTAVPLSAPHSPSNQSTVGRQQHAQRYIQFSSGQHHFPSLSYAQVLQGQYLPDAFRDKLVLVGATAAGLADSIPTPISGLRQPTPGVEFLANTLVSMREQSLIQTTPLWLTMPVTSALVLLPLLWLPRTSPQAGLHITLCFGLLVLIVSILLPLTLYWWLPTSAALVGIFSAYPLWALRKLQAATRFLDQEIVRLGQELTKWAARPDTGTHPDPIQNRIQHIQMATQRLVALDNQQRETLACISHDIRSPIASAAAQVKQELGENSSTYRQLSKVLHWTEDFLHTSRAQMLDPGQFQPLDLIDLLHQVVDDFYLLAKERQLEIDADLPSEPHWVHGHFDSLNRAVANLLGNALKFSPPHGRISISADCPDQFVIVAIRNEGPEIPADQLSHIFKRFGQANTPQARKSSGVGLGLYYVQTVAEKHAGTLHVTSQTGITEFSLRIPTSPHTAG
ncbi:CHASE2 domain-containing protein [Limnohabitans sp.]|uniref:CHASE2 domain-containing protein n=1 Tax=Limnohabitans sp. TaxID=1907725 RepID=UPI00311F4ADB